MKQLGYHLTTPLYTHKQTHTLTQIHTQTHTRTDTKQRSLLTCVITVSVCPSQKGCVACRTLKACEDDSAQEAPQGPEVVCGEQTERRG